jgi:murein DD-endopeptidase MepM/ murein hydrolase activator NlpD
MNEIQQAYDYLNVERGSPLSEVIARYKKLAKTWHPDRVLTEKEKAENTEELKRINCAKEVIQTHFDTLEHNSFGNCKCRDAYVEPSSSKTQASSTNYSSTNSAAWNSSNTRDDEPSDDQDMGGIVIGSLLVMGAFLAISLFAFNWVTTTIGAIFSGNTTSAMSEQNASEVPHQSSRKAVSKILHSQMLDDVVYAPTGKGRVLRQPGSSGTDSEFSPSVLLATSENAKVYALLPGKIVDVHETDDHKGVAVELLHTYPKVRTIYSGLGAASVAAGDWVKRGRVIGYAQESKSGSDEAIGFAVQDSNGQWIDPLAFIQTVPQYVAAMNNALKLDLANKVADWKQLQSYSDKLEQVINGLPSSKIRERLVAGKLRLDKQIAAKNFFLTIKGMEALNQELKQVEESTRNNTPLSEYSKDDEHSMDSNEKIKTTAAIVEVSLNDLILQPEDWINRKVRFEAQVCKMDHGTHELSAFSKFIPRNELDRFRPHLSLKLPPSLVQPYAKDTGYAGEFMIVGILKAEAIYQSYIEVSSMNRL